MKQSLLLSSVLLLLSCGMNTNPKQSNVPDGTVVYTAQQTIEQPTKFPTGFQKPKGVSFQVDDVKIADTFLKTNEAGKVFENKIGKRIVFFPEELSRQKIVSSDNNGLIQTVQECYDAHRPLVLTPDVIWMAISQGVSIHINENHKSLEQAIFKKEKPDKLVVRNDSLEFSSKHWNNLIASLSEQTRHYTNADYYSFFVSEFSTTTPIERTAYQVTLLESYKKTFQYIGDTGCGIPSVHIAGTAEDWKMIHSKLETLNKIGLKEWAGELKSVIQEFINASEGRQNEEFWKDIFKNSNEYNAYYISGWIIKFFPYVKKLGDEEVYDKESGLSIVSEIYTPNPYMNGSDYLLSELSSDNFPAGISQVPLEWNNYFKNETKEMEIYAGFFGMKQYDDKSLEPLISWAVCEKNAAHPHHQLAENKWMNTEHTNYWTPTITKQLTDSAIYDSKRFKTQQESTAYLREYLSGAIRKSRFKGTDLSNDTIRFIVLSNGSVSRVTLDGTDHKELQHYISNLLKQLPKSWMPALARPEEAMMLMEYPEENTRKLKMKVNSEVKIPL